MAHKAVAFTAQQRAELIDIDDPPDLQPDEVRGRTLFSLISAGTELASYTRETSDPPQLTGYAAVAEVEAVGAEVENLAKGDMVFCGDHHKSF